MTPPARPGRSVKIPTGRHRAAVWAVSTEGRADPPASVERGGGTGSGIGERASGFSVTTTSGSSFTFPTGKPTAQLFIASDCPTCIAPAITLNRLERELGDRVAVLGININPTDTPADLAGFGEAAGNPRHGFAIDRYGQLVDEVATEAAEKVASR